MSAFAVLASAIVIDRNEVLLLQRGRSQKFLPEVWGVPCGKINFGEEPSAAAIRELREEAGLDGSNSRLVGTACFTSMSNGVQLFNVQLNYLVEVSSRSVRLSGEHQAFAWHDIERLDTAPADEYNLSVIRQGLDRYRSLSRGE